MRGGVGVVDGVLIVVGGDVEVAGVVAVAVDEAFEAFWRMGCKIIVCSNM